ncbi:hypothetical protein ACFSKW_39290 [Nonomuraea mangrovi]|uniref:Uncharacterized protein n=1 Tax=Nonomuraea mangrovi TaxID=2316207 RepID=A0ABW4T8V4_9ACTN
MTEHRHAEDALQVPPPRADQPPEGRPGDQEAVGADTRDERAEQQWQGQEREERIQDDRTREGRWEDRTEDEHMAQARASQEGMPEQGRRQPMTDADPESPQDDTRYRDPYETRTPDDVLATGTRATDADMRTGDTGMTGDMRTGGERAETAGSAGVETRSEQAAFMLDQDPEQMRLRWREVQACFVDDPRLSVERADTLVDELLSTLTSQAGHLRDRWKNASGSDTEQLRQALREYRSMLDRLLTLTSAER